MDGFLQPAARPEEGACPRQCNTPDAALSELKLQLLAKIEQAAAEVARQKILTNWNRRDPPNSAGVSAGAIVLWPARILRPQRSCWKA